MTDQQGASFPFRGIGSQVDNLNGGSYNPDVIPNVIRLMGARAFGAQLPQHPGAALPNLVPKWNKVWLRNPQVPPDPPNNDKGGGRFGDLGSGTLWGPTPTPPRAWCRW